MAALTPTVITQDDIDKLEKAIAKGVRSVAYNSISISYQSTGEMLEALNYMKRVYAGDSGKPTPSSFAVFSRG